MTASAILQFVGQIAGLGRLALGVFLLLFRDLIRKAVMPAPFAHFPNACSGE